MAHDHDTTTKTTTAASSHHPRQDGGTLRWLVSPTGRMALNHGGFTVTVFRHGATWGFNLKHTQHHALAVRSQRPYPRETPPRTPRSTPCAGPKGNSTRRRIDDTRHDERHDHPTHL